MKIQNSKIKDQNKSQDQSSKSQFFWVWEFGFWICFGFCTLILGFILALSTPASAISSNDLVEKAHLYDGKTIEYQGEVIGDIMRRGNYVWLNVNDGQRAIGIWAGKKLVRNIKNTGNYNYIGDEIKVSGVFHRACPQHGGDLDIHAKEIQVLKQGSAVGHPINWSKITIVVFLFVGIVILLFYPKFLPRKPS